VQEDVYGSQCGRIGHRRRAEVRELFSLAVAGGCAVALGGSRVPRATWVVGREAPVAVSQ
jgi:hypothetical protein